MHFPGGLPGSDKALLTPAAIRAFFLAFSSVDEDCLPLLKIVVKSVLEQEVYLAFCYFLVIKSLHFCPFRVRETPALIIRYHMLMQTGKFSEFMCSRVAVVLVQISFVRSFCFGMPVVSASAC